MRTYLSVHFPLFQSERLLLDAASGIQEPFACVEQVGGRVQLAALDRRALGLGLAPGLTLADARARVPELIVFDVDDKGDTALLSQIADACDRYTPLVAIDPPHALLLDISGCTHRFADGAQGLRTDLERRLRRAGLTPRLAIAHTPDAASALARHGGDDIAALPVTALCVDPDVHTGLMRAGLKTIGAVAAIAPGPLAARFGAALPVLLARLLDDVDTRITPRRVLPAVETEARFAEPVARSEDVLNVITRLSNEAAALLTARGVGGRQFCVALFRSDGHVARLSVETGQPTRDAALLDRLFRERIDALADPLDPGFGYDLIRFAVQVTEGMASEQLRLDGGHVADREFAALIDRLGTRLGRNRVRRFASVDTHIPEQSAFAFPAIEAKSRSGWPVPHTGEPPLRPLHLFDPPHRIQVMAEVPDGPPRRFTWRRALHEVARSEGPERIASEWWTRIDNAGLTRDYYRVEDVRGRRFWLFRHGLYGAEKRHPDWYLHGLFA